MSAVEDVRQVLQHFLAPELSEIRTRLDAINKRFETFQGASDMRYHSVAQRLDAIENANGVRYQAVIQWLEQIQQSFAFDRRISDLESERTSSA